MGVIPKEQGAEKCTPCFGWVSEPGQLRNNQNPQVASGGFGSVYSSTPIPGPAAALSLKRGKGVRHLPSGICRAAFAVWQSLSGNRRAVVAVQQCCAAFAERRGASWLLVRYAGCRGANYRSLGIPTYARPCFKKRRSISWRAMNVWSAKPESRPTGCSNRALIVPFSISV